MPPTLTPQEFVAKWRKNRLKESAASKEHFIDLCHLVGHRTPAELDPKGAFFTFEAFASKQSGGQGFADVWYQGHFAWEYKGQHANLEKAYKQLDDYRVALQNPPILIVSDLDQIILRTNFTNSQQRSYTLSLDDILIPDKLELLRQCFHNPNALQTPRASEIVTRQAAAQFASLAELLRQDGHSPQRSAHFLIRILFCLFAEDAHLLPSPILSNLARNFNTNPLAFGRQLAQLFEAMANGGGFGTELIPHFDGHLFDDAQILPLTAPGIQIIQEVSTLDWSKIEPSIFGTLFERSLDPAKRSQLGAHYTSSEDILLIIEPVLMAPLRREWEEVQREAYALADQFTTVKGAKRNALEAKALSRLQTFADRVAAVRVLDPACGSGNFLYLALRGLLDLQKQAIQLAYELGLQTFIPTVSPAQVYGIEINEYAHQLAQTTIQIGYIQWMIEKGFGAPEEPILKPLDNIRNIDTVLAYDKHGNPYEPEWPAADVIVGNPPFLGGSKLRSELGDSYVEALFALYGDRLPVSDLVCYWFEKARAMIEQGKVKRVGLLTTNSIRSGANRKVLERIKQSGDIFWAQSDRSWILDGANVRVSMVGFDDGSAKEKILDDRAVSQINSDLSGLNIDLTKAHPLAENTGIAFVGSQKNGAFDIPYDVAQSMLTQKGNPNGRPNSDVVKPSANGASIMGVPRNMWIIDFEPGTSEETAAQYELPFEYILVHVKPDRLLNNRAAYAKRWWIHGEPRPGMRTALAPLSRFIVTSRVSKHRVFIWLSRPTLPDHKLAVFAREDDYFFGVLHSKIHEIWTLATCSWMGVGNDPAYSASRTFETFPFPWAPDHEPLDDPRTQAIAPLPKSWWRCAIVG
jgi:hypothetical protein